MDPSGTIAMVTGGASGLGRAAAERLTEAGARVVLVDLPSSDGAGVAEELRSASFVPADVRSPDEVQAAVDAAAAQGPLRILVHCAGRGGSIRVVDKDGKPGSLESYEEIVRTNLIGTFNVLRLAAASMVGNDLIGEEREVRVLTASVAAYEGQIGQIGYASSKAGVVGMTLVAARDLAGRQIRVCTIAPGLFDTPLLAQVPEGVRRGLGDSVPHPRRLGQPSEFAELAISVIKNAMLNGETIRLDGTLRMAPR